MTDAERIEIYERYLSDEVSLEEKAAFEITIQEDRNWQTWIARYRMMSQAIEYQAEKDLHQEMRGWQSKQVISEPILKTFPLTKRFWYRGFSIAASLMILLLSGFWYLHRHYSDSALVDAYYQLPLNPGIRSTDATSKDDFALGMIALYRDDWKEAIRRFSAITETHTEYQLSRYYLGHANFNDRQYAKALDFFAGLDGVNLPQSPTVDWMIALTHVRLNEDQLAMDQLDKIISMEDHPYQAKAFRFLTDLHNFWRFLF